MLILTRHPGESIIIDYSIEAIIYQQVRHEISKTGGWVRPMGGVVSVGTIRRRYNRQNFSKLRHLPQFAQSDFLARIARKRAVWKAKPSGV